ncbi:MAG: SDR family NAD(P)-dependent oxidoreductase [Spirochaetota bacterium]
MAIEVKKMFLEFKDKVVLVTGAAGGIGQRISERFSENEAVVYKTDIKEGDDPFFIQGDICDTAFPEKCTRWILNRSGRIDILINNAGICPRTQLFDITSEEWHRVLEVNLTAVFSLSQSVMKIMIDNRAGTIINIASLAGKNGGIAVGAHYSASKAGVACLTKTLARCGAPFGIRVNAVAPGVIDTEMTSSAGSVQAAAFNEAIPLKRIGTVDEIAGPILFLASNLASYITGAVLDINGGLLMD